MVRSRLDPSVNYTELKSIDPSDSKETNYRAPLYEAIVMGINTIISIGQIKNTFIEKNIVYYPIYLIKNDKVISQIGVYELFEETVASILDDEGDINLDKTPPPLIYSFVTKTLIQKAVFIPENPSAALAKGRAKPALPKVTASAAAAAAAAEDEDTESDEDIQAAIHASLVAPKDVSKGPIKIPKRLPVQTMDQFDSELRNFRERPDQPWIQRYYINNEFNIVKSPVDSDSFFYAICDAIRSVYPDRDINIINLREKLAGVISVEQYSAYKSLYDSFSLQLQRNRQRNEEIVAENQDLKTRLTGSQSLSEKKQIRERALVLKAENEELKEKREAIKDNMKYVNFMKGVHNIEQLRDVIRVGEGAGEFRADEWAISALEIILNIKLIIFSKTDFHDNNDKAFAMTNVIHCGKNVSKSQKDFIVQEIEKMKSGKPKSGAMVALDEPKGKGATGLIRTRDKYEFIPDHYIMLSETDKHYDLITYRETKMFTFAEIPYCVKLQITSRCLQGFELSGIYTNIPQFMLFMKEDMEATNKFLMKDIESELADLDKSSNPHYNDSLRLVHHALSSNKMPGFAQGDVVSPTDMKGFMNLMGGGGNNDKGGKNNWRRKISNEWCQPFTLDGHRWLSVEHYYQGNKFLKTFPEFYLLFTMDANKKSKYYDETSILSRISNDVELATVAGKKNPTTTIDGKKVSLRPSSVAIDPDFFNGRHSRVLEDGTMAKFSQNDDLDKVLLMTNNAKLINYSHTKHTTPSMHIMHVRSKLRTKSGKINDYEAIQ
jgi:predicted NAD-dependent protein-ADP-ribosyltransferase YbiA (DUF1768 family)